MVVAQQQPDFIGNGFSAPSETTHQSQLLHGHHAIGDMSAMSMVPPPQQIGMNEMLIRMGSWPSRRTDKYLESLAPWVTHMLAHRTPTVRQLAAYQAQMEARGRHSAKNRAENMAQAGQTTTHCSISTGSSALESGQSVTGWIDGAIGAAWDSFETRSWDKASSV